MYQDEAIIDIVTIKFRDENALEDGVSRDMYTQFYKDVFRLYSSASAKMSHYPFQRGTVKCLAE